MTTTKAEFIKSSSNEHQDFYSKVTQKIISDLELGQLPWRKNASSKVSYMQLLRPLRSNSVPYSGINKILLSLSASEHGFESPYWMTLRQATELNANVPSDAQTTTVVFADKVVTEEPGEDGEIQKFESTHLKEYSVYNAEQIEGLQDFYYKKSALPNQKNRIKNIEKFIADSKAQVQTGSVAAYTALTDEIVMPPINTFSNQESYYSAFLVELVHWTQHESRLNRDFKKERNTDHILAKEALVAELGSCFLAAELGLEFGHAEVPAAFFQSWLQILKHDNRFIFMAASQAQKSVEYLLNLQIANQHKPRSVAAEPKPAVKNKPVF